VVKQRAAITISPVFKIRVSRTRSGLDVRATLSYQQDCRLKPISPQRAAGRKAPPSEHAANLMVRLLKEGALIGLGAICLYLMLAMMTYDANDPGWSRTGNNTFVTNAGGPFGAWIADVFFSLFGYLAYLFPVMIAYRAWRA